MRTVITGMGVICGYGIGQSALLQGLLSNTSCIQSQPEFQHRDLMASLASKWQELPDEGIDRCLQLALLAAKEALVDAGLTAESDTRDVALILGTAAGGVNSLYEYLRSGDPNDERLVSYPVFQIAGQLAKRLGIGGPVFVVNTACTASGHALGLAQDLLRSSSIMRVLVGGAEPIGLPVYAGFNSLQSLATQPASPCDVRTGLSLGDGSGFVVLEKREQALARGQRIDREFIAYGVGTDGYHITAPDPEGAGVTRAIQLALKAGAVDQASIAYINLHGTGTQANDAAELKGIEGALGTKARTVPLSSLKGHFGHHLGAAAMIELIATLLSLDHGWLPTNLHLESPREGCENFNLVASPTQTGPIDRFMSLNSAFGGHNTALILGTDSTPAKTEHLAVYLNASAVIWKDEHGSLPAHRLTENVPIHGTQNCSYQLNRHFPDLYRRRMNHISQMALGSSQLALQNSPDHRHVETGIFYATALGSSESVRKSVGGLVEDGPKGIRSIVFPDTVLNATLGYMTEGLQLRGPSASLSLGGGEGLLATWAAAQQIGKKQLENALVTASDDISDLTEALAPMIGWTANDVPLSEGSASVCLSAAPKGEKPLRLGPWALSSCVQGVPAILAELDLDSESFDFILLSAAGGEGIRQNLRDDLRRCLKPGIPIWCVDETHGYAPAMNSLLLLPLAAELVHGTVGMQRGLLISGATIGTLVAVVVSRP